MEKCELPPNRRSRSGLLEGRGEAWPGCRSQAALASLAQTALQRDTSRSRQRDPLRGRKFLIRSRRKNSPCPKSFLGHGLWGWWMGQWDPELALSNSHSRWAVGGMPRP